MNGPYDDPQHPILPTPYLWDLLEFKFHTDSSDWMKSFIDLVFIRDDQRRRFRFFGPQTLEISEGELNCMGLIILDVSARQLDGIRVRVTNFEQSWGAPTFWARSVIEVSDDYQ